MFSKTTLTKTLAIALGLAVAASTASADCILTAADGTSILIPRGGCFYGGTQEQYTEFGGLGCGVATQIFFIPEFNDRAVSHAMTHAPGGWGGRLNLHNDDSNFQGGRIAGGPQILAFDFHGGERENVSVYNCQ